MGARQSHRSLLLLSVAIQRFCNVWLTMKFHIRWIILYVAIIFQLWLKSVGALSPFVRSDVSVVHFTSLDAKTATGKSKVNANGNGDKVDWQF